MKPRPIIDQDMVLALYSKVYTYGHLSNYIYYYYNTKYENKI